MPNRLIAAAALTLTVLATACGTAPDAAKTAEDATLLPAHLKLYASPNQTPDPGCDVYTSLVLANGIVGPLAVLQGKVDGFCEIAVDTAQRVYNLSAEDAGGGSTLFTGERDVDGDAGDRVATVQILDHRARFCRDLVEAPVIVTETLGTKSRDFFSAL
jgi:hypothetical protein